MVTTGDGDSEQQLYYGDGVGGQQINKQANNPRKQVSDVHQRIREEGRGERNQRENYIQCGCLKGGKHDRGQGGLR